MGTAGTATHTRLAEAAPEYVTLRYLAAWDSEHVLGAAQASGQMVGLVDGALKSAAQAPRLALLEAVAGS